MNVDDLIDSALSQGDNVSESDQAYVERRRRALAFTREVFNDAYWARDWPRRKTSASLTVPAATGQVAVPVDYGSIGQFGGLYLVVGGRPQPPFMDRVPESEITDSRAGQQLTDSPDKYAIFGMVEVGTGSGVFRDLIQLPMNVGALTLELHYQRKPPKLLDAGDPDADLSYTLASLTSTLLAATATTGTAHGFKTDDLVVISGAVETAYNGTFRVIVTGATTFTYTLLAAAAASPATGTITAAIAIAAGNSALNYISEMFHESVLLNGVKAKLRESKGDGRWQFLEGQYQKQLAAMKRERTRFEGQNRRMPSFFGSGGRR